MGTVLTLLLIGLAAFGAWKWAVAQGSAATLDRIDSLFPRARGVQLVENGRYGPAGNQNVELWTPAGTAPAGGWPTVVFVYGGGWHSGDTRSYRFVARTLAEQGFATALVGYRLVPEGRFPAMLEDTANGIGWLRAHAAQAGMRADDLVLIGHSAGAYNVLMLGLDPQWLAAAGVPMDAVAGIVSLAGPTDFYPFTSDSGRNALGHVADPMTTQPITFARAGAPPLLLMHGTADTVVRVRNARRLQAAMDAAGGASRTVVFDGMGHAGIVMGLSKPFAQGGKVLDPMLAFVRAVRTGSRPAAPASVPVQRPDR